MDKEIIRNEGFIQIEGWMIKELGLTNNDLMVFAIIFGFNKKGKDWFHGSREYLATWCTCSTSGIDKNLKNLSYESFFGMNFHSNELEYEIFAYEFVDSDSALKYYINVTGQNSYEKELPLDDSDENKRLSSSKGMSSYRLIAVHQNKAYVIVAPKQYEDVINKMLTTTFSFQLS